MFMLLFFIVLIYECVSMIIWSVSAMWGLVKTIAFVLLLPIVLVVLAIIGLLYVALGIIILLAVIATIGGVIWM